MDSWMCCSVPTQHVWCILFPEVPVLGLRQLSVSLCVRVSAYMSVLLLFLIDG